MYAPVEQKAFTFADRCEEAFIIARFDGMEASVKIHAVDQEQMITLLQKLIERLGKGKLR